MEDSFGFDESKLLSGISFLYCTVKNIVIIGKHAGYNAHLAFVVIDLSYCGNTAQITDYLACFYIVPCHHLVVYHLTLVWAIVYRLLEF